MYAIIQARGRQLKVTPGAVVEIDGRPGDQGSEMTFDQVLLVARDAGDIVAGAPFVANARVTGVVDGVQKAEPPRLAQGAASPEESSGLKPGARQRQAPGA